MPISALNKARPEGAVGVLNGCYIKIGRFDKVFVHDGTEWIRSSKSLKKVKKKLDKKTDRFSFNEPMPKIETKKSKKKSKKSAK